MHGWHLYILDEVVSFQLQPAHFPEKYAAAIVETQERAWRCVVCKPCGSVFESGDEARHPSRGARKQDKGHRSHRNHRSSNCEPVVRSSKSRPSFSVQGRESLWEQKSWNAACISMFGGRQLAHQIIIKAEGDAQQTLVRNQATGCYQVRLVWIGKPGNVAGWCCAVQIQAASASLRPGFVHLRQRIWLLTEMHHRVMIFVHVQWVHKVLLNVFRDALLSVVPDLFLG